MTDPAITEAETADTIAIIILKRIEILDFITCSGKKQRDNVL